MAQSFTEKYRPQSIQEMLLTSSTAKNLETLLNIANDTSVILLIGPSGYGKTTAARIIAKQILENDTNLMNLREINAANQRGIDDVREITQFVEAPSVFASKNVVILNEAQQLTVAAQNCLLDPMEGNKRACFILTTTDPQKIIKTIKTRAYEVVFDQFDITNKTDVSIIVDYLNEIISKEPTRRGRDLSLLEAIARSEPNSIRKHVAKLGALIAADIYSLTKEATSIILGFEEQLESSAIKIARLITEKQFTSNGNIKYDQWGRIAREINLLSDNPEAARRIIAGYIRAIIIRTDSITDKQIFFARCKMLSAFTSETEITKERLLTLILKALYSEDV